MTDLVASVPVGRQFQ